MIKNGYNSSQEDLKLIHFKGTDFHNILLDKNTTKIEICC